MKTNPSHVCRDGHEQIHHYSHDEMCPLCKVKAENDALKLRIRGMIQFMATVASQCYTFAENEDKRT